MSATVDIAVCMKWTARSGASDADARFAGISAADRAALETALVLAEQSGGSVTAVAAGPVAAELALREALACGAHRAVRLDAPSTIESAEVARQLAGVVAEAAIVVCGDCSLDRGSGAVPGFLAHRLHAAQALGLIHVDPTGVSARALQAIRRLDGGRRELLTVPLPCVLSVEGSAAQLRRAGLRASLAARTATIEVRPAVPFATHEATAVVTAYRPRSRAMTSPVDPDPLQRLRALTDAKGSSARGETVTLEPGEAAERILRSLREWGYLT
jgi:electron transfer flavoprotein beta subunit